MTREQKIEKRKQRSINRAIKNGQRNHGRKSRSRNDCPYDVEINGRYGTCHCGGVNISECAADI
jgi:ribosome modulation factor